MPQPVHFTQEDPIGLAGGMDLYGYGNGDPINNSDPFGLCTPWPACANDYWEAAGVAGHQQGGVGGTLKAAGAALMGSLIEGFGINQADRGMSAIADGRTGVGLAMVGLAVADNLPGGRLAAASGRLLGEAVAGIGVRKSIAGAGSRAALRDVDRLVGTYGGDAGDRAKMVGASEKVDGKVIQVHWYENTKTGFRTEFKHNLP